MIWLEQVRRRAPHLLSRDRNYVQISPATRPRLQQTSAPMEDQPKSQPSVKLKAKAHVPGTNRAATRSRIPARKESAALAGSAPKEENKQELAPLKYQESQRVAPSPIFKLAPPSLPKLKPLPEESGAPTPNSDPEQIHPSGDDFSSMPEYSAVKTERTTSTLRPQPERAVYPAPERDPKEAEKHPEIFAAPCPVKIPAEGLSTAKNTPVERESGRNDQAKSKAGSLSNQDRRPSLSTWTLTEPMAQPFAQIAFFENPKESSPSIGIEPVPFFVTTDQTQQVFEPPLISEPGDRWASLLPDRQPESPINPCSLWRENEYRRRLLDEQRGA